MKAESIFHLILKIIPSLDEFLWSRCFFTKHKTGDNHVNQDKIKRDLLRVKSQHQ